jgi:DNA-binding transcriptional MocR family regulator
MDFSSIVVNPAARVPLYRQLEDAVAAAIADGALAVGDRLPSERDLAFRLGLSRTTAINAYRELEARGLVRGQVGRGTFVCAAGGEPADAPFAWQGKVALAAQRARDPSMATMAHGHDADTISFAASAPALDLFPTAAFRDLVAAAFDRQPAAFGMGPIEGQPALRSAVAARQGVRPEQVLILNGSQQGLDLVARCLLDPGDAVVMDRPGYVGAIQVFRAAGAHLVGWDVSRADLDELEDLLQRYRPKLLYTNPSFQNPTGRTLPAATRRDLLALAARYRLPVVEDDAYRELFFRTPPPKTLLELDEHGLVVHLGSFSKSLAAGLRLGWLAAPEAVVGQLALARQRADLFGPGAMQLAVAEMVTRGGYDAHLRAARAEHARRHAAMTAALARRLPPSTGVLSWAPVEGGLNLWCRVAPGVDARRVARLALEAGVAIVPGETFYPDGAGGREFRLCFGRNPPSVIEVGVDRLARVLTANPAFLRGDGPAYPLV